jgi:cytochrome bd-type quinol oxidase subunit 2
MEPPPCQRYLEVMTTTTAPADSSRSLAVLAGLVLAGFGVFSCWVVATQGYFGFVRLADHEPWALQMLLDLVIACAFAVSWVVRDARKRGIASWPFVVATLLLGTIGVLAYCVRRSFA